MKAREFVDLLSYKEIVSILESYKDFEKLGMIGDKPIRIYAHKMLDSIGMSEHNQITIWIDMLAKECALNLAKKYISMRGEK
jgi:hypothetical protein